jgi:hypothetical protein
MWFAVAFEMMEESQAVLIRIFEWRQIEPYDKWTWHWNIVDMCIVEVGVNIS